MVVLWQNRIAKYIYFFAIKLQIMFLQVPTWYSVQKSLVDIINIFENFAGLEMTRSKQFTEICLTRKFGILGPVVIDSV